MTAHGVLLFLISATLVLTGALFIWFLLRVRPRSIAFRLIGAALSLTIVFIAAVVFVDLQIASLKHAAVDSEGGTFVYGMLSYIGLVVGAVALVPASLIWSSGIRKHPEPVSWVERTLQKTTLFGPLVLLSFLAVLLAWRFLTTALGGGAG